MNFNTIPKGIRVPLFYAEVDNSMANTGANLLRTLLIGQMLPTGTATPMKPVMVSTTDVAKKLFGRGSVLAIMTEKFRLQNTEKEVWAIPLNEPANGAKASGTFTFTGETSESGTIYAYIGATAVTANVQSGTTAVAVAQAVAAAINGKPDLPVTAKATESEEKGVVTIEAKNVGTIGNEIKISVNYFGYQSGEELPDGIAVDVSQMAGGTGPVDVDALEDAIKDDPYEFIAIPYPDARVLEKMRLIMNDKTGRWSPFKQLYGHVFTSLRGTAETLSTFGKTLNDQHLTIDGFEDTSPNANFERLGAYVGQVATALKNDPARPLQTLELLGITEPKPGERFTLTEQQTLLTSGIAATMVSGNAVRISRAVTTYQKNALGDPDTSYMDSETLFSLAYIIRQMRSIITSKYPRHKLGDDGTRYANGQPIVTPKIIKAELIGLYYRLESEAVVENFKKFEENLIVERAIDDPNRLEVQFPPDLINGLRVVAVQNQFRLQYN